jgi:hypothetical protein
LAEFSQNVAGHAEISEATKAQVEQRLSSGGSFVSADQVRHSAEQAGVDEAETSAIVDGYRDAQLQSLKLALLIAALLTIPSFWSARNLPGRVLGAGEGGVEPAQST